MAKKRSAVATKTIVLRPVQARRSVTRRPTVTIVRAPSAKPVKHHKRRHGGGGGAHNERHRIGAMLGGYALGMIDKSDLDIPTVPFLGRAGTVGIAAYAIYRLTGNPWADAAATGILSIAAYELSKEGEISGYDDGL